MKNVSIIQAIGLYAIFVIGIFLFIYYLVRLVYAIHNDNRICLYSTKRINNKEISIVDNIEIILFKFINNLVRRIDKVKIIKFYGSFYNKYLLFEDNSVFSGTFFIIEKLFLGLLGVFFYTIGILLKLYTISIVGYIIIFIICYFIIDIIIFFQYQRKFRTLEDELYKSIIIVSNALNNNLSINRALDLVNEKVGSYTSVIIDDIKKDLSVNISLYNSFNRIYTKYNLKPFKVTLERLKLLDSEYSLTDVFNNIKDDIERIKKKKIEFNIKCFPLKIIYILTATLPILLSIVLFVINYNKIMNNLYLFAITFYYLLLLLVYVVYIIIYKKCLKVNYYGR